MTFRGLVLLCCLTVVGASSHPSAQGTQTAAYAEALEVAIELVVNDTMLVPQLQRTYDAAPYSDVKVDPTVSAFELSTRVEQILSTQPLESLRSLAQAAVTAHHAAAPGTGAEQMGATEGDYVRPEQVNGSTHARFSVTVDTQRSAFILNDDAGATPGPTQALSPTHARFISGMTNATRLNFENSDSVTFQCTKNRRTRSNARCDCSMRLCLCPPYTHRLLSHRARPPPRTVSHPATHLLRPLRVPVRSSHNGARARTYYEVPPPPPPLWHTHLPPASILHRARASITYHTSP